jgi:hypothetical protein
VSELHTWLARGTIVTVVILSPSQQGARQEDGFEEFPHDAPLAMKPRKGWWYRGATMDGQQEMAPFCPFMLGIRCFASRM